MMCGTCGCSDDAGGSIDGEHQHALADGTVVTHQHDGAGAHQHALADGTVVTHQHDGAGAHQH
ncbi:MAG: hydrogenase accessory protein HypB, partial [Myxococcaceae bacterium]|nr:hydrogenase accessory protein HypB [Myxococcaceae bacterium]